VTDDKDIRLIKSILQRFITPECVITGNKFSESGIYTTIEAGSQSDYM
jgi:hypothetical protein